MSLRLLSASLGLLVCLLITPAARAGSYEDAVKAAAVDFVAFAQNQGKAKVTVNVKFLGLPTMPNGAGAGFVELMKEHLASFGIQISQRADYSLVARLKVDLEQKSARLVATISDQNGEDLDELNQLPLIDNAKDLAELLGIPIDFGPEPDHLKRLEALKKRFESTTFNVGSSQDGTRHALLYSDLTGKYGIGLRVEGQHRPFKNQKGLPYTQLELGEQYALLLVNNTDQEVAVNVKVDGVNVFHFSDQNVLRPDGGKYKYWIVAPRSATEVRGWFKNDNRQLRFAITPVEEGAAAKAGLPLEEVGLVTATFHASWEGDQTPKDEPKIEKQVTVMESLPVQQTRTVRLPDGTYKTETYTVARMQAKVIVSTGFGEEVITNTKGVNRTIGISRATLAFRYERPEP